MELDYHIWLLVFLRVSAFLLVLPFFSAANFPVMLAGGPVGVDGAVAGSVVAAVSLRTWPFSACSV